MSNPEIITVNSEALEATVRDLLPSQNGFGSELQASNIITPIIDLTPTAEGSICVLICKLLGILALVTRKLTADRPQSSQIQVFFGFNLIIRHYLAVVR